jgi:DNA-binding NarL/FixJ family response regulator
MHLLLATHQPDMYQSIHEYIRRNTTISKLTLVESFADLVRRVEKGCFDKILLDWELPGMAPQRQLDFIERICPHARIIVITDKPTNATEAVRAGVDAYICDIEPRDSLIKMLVEAENMRL